MPLKKKIHVNQHNIRYNKNHPGENKKPVITVKTYKSNSYGHKVEIDGPSKLVYPEKGLSCGARVWLESKSPVKIYDDEGNLIEEIE